MRNNSMTVRGSLLFFVMSLIAPFSVVLCAPDTQDGGGFYKDVQRQCLAPIVWEDEEWPNEPLYDYLMRCMEHQRHPQEAKRCRAAFKILDSCKQQDKEKPVSVLRDTQTWEDLCLLYSPHYPTTSLLSIINRTHTYLGKATLASLLVQPIDDVGVLHKRQQILKELIDNPELLERLDTLLKNLAEHENILMSFWSQDQLYQAARHCYFTIPYFKRLNNSLNRNTLALSGKVLFEHGKRSVFFLCTAFAALALPVYGISRLAEITIKRDTRIAAGFLRSSGGPSIGVLMAAAELYAHSVYKTKLFQGWMSIFSGWLCGLSAKGDYEWTRDNVVLMTCLQEKLIAVAHSLRTLKKMAAVLDSNVALYTGLSTATALDDFVHQAPGVQDDFSDLIQLLGTKTFKNKPSVTSHAGIILRAYCLMHTLHNEWVKALSAVGEIDAYVSMAKLYKESKTTKNPYCFATFITGDKPSLVMKNVWNPFVSNDKAVPNSIRLGAAAPRPNMIVTGPITGGKSTLLRALALNLVMIQSFGIAPAESVAITPFSAIITDFTSSDDRSGTSLFKKEALRSSFIIDTMGSLKKGAWGFVVFDEMFSRVTPQEGQAAAYGVAKHIGALANTISVIATHYDAVTTLAQTTPHFANFKVTVSVNPDGTLDYPFALVPGVSDQNIVLAMLKAQGFASSIIKDAQTLVEQRK